MKESSFKFDQKLSNKLNTSLAAGGNTGKHGDKIKRTTTLDSNFSEEVGGNPHAKLLFQKLKDFSIFVQSTAPGASTSSLTLSN